MLVVDFVFFTLACFDEALITGLAWRLINELETFGQKSIKASIFLIPPFGKHVLMAQNPGPGIIFEKLYTRR